MRTNAKWFRRRKGTRQLFVWALVACFGGLAAPGSAQVDRQRSETGRHAPAPKRAVTTPAEIAPAGEKPGIWRIGLGMGTMGGGDLWRVETAGQTVVPWQSAVAFSSERFSATLANNFGVGLYVGRRMSDYLTLRLDGGASRMDITAEALQGQRAGVFGYDRLNMRVWGLTGEARLAKQVSTPYATVGVIVNRMTAARESDLDQTQVGFRVGLGYEQAMVPEFSLRAELRYSQTGFDLGDFRPTTKFASQPELDLSPADDVNLFEVVLILQANL